MSPSNSPCRICNGFRYSPVMSFGRAYHRCLDCGTLQLDITHEAYRAMEPGYDPGVFLASRSISDVRAYLKVDQRKSLLIEALRWAGIDPEGRRFLDVGCGMGGYLEAARDLGMSAKGFEPSHDHGKVAVEVLGHDVIADYFDASRPGGETYDLIMLSHVIEHIYRPRAMMDDLFSVLAPGGCLVVVTPNVDGLVARLCGGRWPMLLPIDHVTMLGPRAIPWLVPNGAEHALSTSEYPEEFLATLGSVAKTALRGGAPHADPAVPATAGSVVAETSLAARLLRGVLAAGSLPFHLAATATNRASAMRLFIRKNGKTVLRAKPAA